MKQKPKYILELALVPVAAAVVFFEQVLIRYLNVVMAAFARLPWIARLEAWLVTLPPWAALLAFAAPSVLILPIKVSAFWFAVHGRYGLSALSIIIGKLVATAILARLYRILRPTMMTVRWFAWADTHFFYWRDRAYGFVRSLPAWQKAAALVARGRAWLKEVRRSWQARKA